jgi:hypothetical protein
VSTFGLPPASLSLFAKQVRPQRHAQSHSTVSQLENFGSLGIFSKLNSSRSSSRSNRGKIIYTTVGAVFGTVLIGSVGADPLVPPTVQYVADVEITRDSDHSVNIPVRYVFAGRRIRVEFVGNVALIDLDRKQKTTMMPRVKTYWAPTTLSNPIGDGRRWVGVEAATAEVVGTDMLLGQPVTKYRVHGKIFDNRTPFEGDVWTTAENIVLQVSGMGQSDGSSTPIKVTPVQLVVGPVDPSLLTVPSNFAKARASEGD